VSLRARLVALVLVLTTSLLGGLGLYVGSSLRTWTLEVVDADLARRADVLSREVHYEHGRLEVEEEEDVDAHSWPFLLETLEGEVLRGRQRDWAVDLQPGFTTVEGRGGAPLRVLTRTFVPRESDEPLRLRVAAPLKAYSGLAERFRVGLLVALLLAVVLGAAGATLMARVLLAPLERLSRDVDGLGAASLAHRLDPAGLGPELSRLAASFNGLLARLETAFEAQRAFIGRASHALRTPLASILSQAEVSLRRERTPEAYRTALEDIAEAARDSAGLADGLLALTRADAAQVEAKTAVRLDEVAAELLRLFGPRAEVAGLTFTATAPPALAVVATRARLKELLDALLDNAFRYTPRGGAVGFTARAEGERVLLEVSDTGPGVPADEREKVFERFFRGSAAAQSGQRGSGLGLAVVRALATAEGAQVSLHDAPGGTGTCARLSYPASSG
jgi:signal transduction histidine kinase